MTVTKNCTLSLHAKMHKKGQITENKNNSKDIKTTKDNGAYRSASQVGIKRALLLRYNSVLIKHNLLGHKRV
jgi:hypothetical protein